MLYSHVASQILTCAVFCNCLNCQPRQAFNKCKLIFSVSKISLPCTVYVPFAHHVPRFSQIVMFANKIKQKKILKITSDKKKITTTETFNGPRYKQTTKKEEVTT